MCKALDGLICAHRAAYDNFIRCIDLNIDGPEYAAADDAETATAIALCLFRCPKPETMRKKLAYLASAPSLGAEMQPKHITAIISSMRA